MPDIYHIHNQTGVSIRTLKKLEKTGFLKASICENPVLSKIDSTLRKGNRISAIDLAYLVENPGLIFDLGRNFSKADEQLRELGDPLADVPNATIASTIDFAASGRPESVEKLLSWIKGVIPSDRVVPYTYVAVRAFLSDGPHIRKFMAGRLPKAILNVREHPDFAAWYTLRPTKYGRNATFYHVPKMRFDL